MDASEKLKSWMSREGWGNQRLARELGVSCPYVSQWRSNARQPGRDKAIKLEVVTKGAVRVSDWKAPQRRRA